MDHKNEVQTTLLHALPIFICWNLWKNKCSAKYGEKHSNMARYELVNIVQKCNHELSIKPDNWIRPPDSWYKLNTDGSALTSPGTIGGGGILRDHTGDMVFSFNVPLELEATIKLSNNQAEFQGTSFGLDWCFQHGYKRIILEVDSEHLTHWIKHNITPPWRMQQNVDALKDLIQSQKGHPSTLLYSQPTTSANQGKLSTGEDGHGQLQKKEA
ncbi:hypothetical protein KY289_026706 [Solanum tuberosum]|nr:hypothetical protein KY289_026706 [Solanum tuberosum]